MKDARSRSPLWWKMALGIVVLFLVQAPIHSEAADYQAEQDYASGSKPYALTVADLNGDGHADLASSNVSSHDVTIWLGNGDGSFGGGSSYATGTQPYTITNGDFNEDGHVDLATADRGSNTVSILIGHGDGTFDPSYSIPADVGPNRIMTADFNEDSHLDLAISNQSSNQVSIMLGNGDGTFGALVGFSVVEEGGYEIMLGDFNNDGHVDMAICINDSPTYVVSVLLGDGLGGFAASVNYPVLSQPVGGAAGDVDGDGILDLVITHGGAASDKISILLGNGDGTFKPAIYYGTGGHDSRGVVIADFTADGVQDLAVAHFGDNTLAILAGTIDEFGNHAFAAAVPYLTNYSSLTDLVSSDFNEDGLLDFAFPLYSIDKIGVQLASRHNANLQSLTLSGGASLNLPFNAATHPYTSSVTSDVYSITVTPTPEDAAATITVQVNGGASTAVAGGAASSWLSLQYGVNTIAVNVTAQDGTTTSSYTVDVTRANPPVITPPALSSNADLSGLSVTENAGLDPAFDANLQSYSLQVDYPTDQVHVIPIAADHWATLTVKVNGGTPEAVESGSESSALPLNIGTNTIEVTVKAEDGTLKGYTILLTRQAAVEEQLPTAVCPFIDIHGHWAEAAICEASSLGIVAGVDALHYVPDREVTRAEFATIMMRALQIPVNENPAATPAYRDYANIPAWAQPLISTGTEKGFLSGYPDGFFRPEKPISREEAVTMLARAMKWDETGERNLPYADRVDISPWALPFVAAVYDHGLLHGRENNRLEPTLNMTRAETAVFLLQLWKLQN